MEPLGGNLDLSEYGTKYVRGADSANPEQIPFEVGCDRICVALCKYCAFVRAGTARARCVGLEVEAEVCFLKAAQVAEEELDDLGKLGAMLCNAATCAHARGDSIRAVQMLRRVLKETASRRGAGDFRLHRLRALSGLSAIALAVENAQEWRKWSDQLLALSDQCRDQRERGLFLTYLAEVSLHTGPVLGRGALFGFDDHSVSASAAEWVLVGLLTENPEEAMSKFHTACALLQSERDSSQDDMLGPQLCLARLYLAAAEHMAGQKEEAASSAMGALLEITESETKAPSQKDAQKALDSTIHRYTLLRSCLLRLAAGKGKAEPAALSAAAQRYALRQGLNSARKHIEPLPDAPGDVPLIERALQFIDPPEKAAHKKSWDSIAGWLSNGDDGGGDFLPRNPASADLACSAFRPDVKERWAGLSVALKGPGSERHVSLYTTLQRAVQKHGRHVEYAEAIVAQKLGRLVWIMGLFVYRQVLGTPPNPRQSPNWPHGCFEAGALPVLVRLCRRREVNNQGLSWLAISRGTDASAFNPGVEVLKMRAHRGLGCGCGDVLQRRLVVVCGHHLTWFKPEKSDRGPLTPRRGHSIPLADIKGFAFGTATSGLHSLSQTHLEKFGVRGSWMCASIVGRKKEKGEKAPRQLLELCWPGYDFEAFFQWLMCLQKAVRCHSSRNEIVILTPGKILWRRCALRFKQRAELLGFHRLSFCRATLALHRRNWKAANSKSVGNSFKSMPTDNTGAPLILYHQSATSEGEPTSGLEDPAGGSTGSGTGSGGHIDLSNPNPRFDDV